MFCIQNWIKSRWIRSRKREIRSEFAVAVTAIWTGLGSESKLLFLLSVTNNFNWTEIKQRASKLINVVGCVRSVSDSARVAVPCRPGLLSYNQFFRTCKTRSIFGDKCAHFSALYYVNAFHVSFSWQSLVFRNWILSKQISKCLKTFITA